MALVARPKCLSLDDCQGEIFQLYIKEERPLGQVIKLVERKFGVKATPAMYKKKLQAWKFQRNTKKSIVLAILRQPNFEQYEFYMNGRPLDIGKIKRFRARDHIQARSVDARHGDDPGSTVIQVEGVPGLTMIKRPFVHRQDPAGPMDGMQTVEKVLSDINRYVTRSFEDKEKWRMNGLEQIIISSAKQESDIHVLHSFLTALDTGLAKFVANNGYGAGLHWRIAFREIESLVKGDYHDIIPNIIQRINDLHSKGHPALARSLRIQVARLGFIYQPSGDVKSLIYRALGQLDNDQMVHLEAMMMSCYSKLFNFYLGDACYNTFVVQMDTVTRKLAVDHLIDIDDSLPALSILDHKFGPSNRRPLDVIRLKVETLYNRSRYFDARLNAAVLVQRAENIVNDEWQRHYFLIKGLYYAGNSSFFLTGKEAEAEFHLTRCFHLIEAFYQTNHNYAMFDTEQTQILDRLEELAIRNGDLERVMIWMDHRTRLQARLDDVDNTIEMFQELQSSVNTNLAENVGTS